jgi:dTDP-4-amino-4,6-dideoxygalactose transaminase
MPVNKIPPVDLVRQYQLISEETGAAVLDILSSGRYIGGSVVTDLENQLADYVGVSRCVSCNSGTDALYLALRALNIGEGDEVITSPFTFIATAEAITMTGATPVFVDIDPKTFNMDVDQIETVITNKTKAIIPVHLFGQAVNMTKVMEIAAQYHLFVVEDCAQATGAKWEGQQVGSIGHIGCFSFFPTKNLGGCGDGGAITTNDPALADTIDMLKGHGSRVRYYHEAVGVNSRLDAIQAAILLVKLRYLDQWNQQRRQVAENYHNLLQAIPNIQLPQEVAGSYHVWNQYTILMPNIDEHGELLRDRVRSQLQHQGIMSMVYYPLPLHLQPVYQALGYEADTFPQAEITCHQVLSLPMFPELTFAEQEQVTYSLKDYLTSSLG